MGTFLQPCVYVSLQAFLPDSERFPVFPNQSFVLALLGSLPIPTLDYQRPVSSSTAVATCETNACPGEGHGEAGLACLRTNDNSPTLRSLYSPLLFVIAAFLLLTACFHSVRLLVSPFLEGIRYFASPPKTWDLPALHSNRLLRSI